MQTAIQAFGQLLRVFISKGFSVYCLEIFENLFFLCHPMKYLKSVGALRFT
jgi:hypothetical protein